MSDDAGLLAWIEEMLEPLGILSSRAMMGGCTLYLDGTVFAIVGDDEIWFKADAASDAEWDALGARRFSYRFKDGRVGTMNYRLASEAVLDDPDEFRRLALLARAAGERAPARKRKAT